MSELILYQEFITSIRKDVSGYFIAKDYPSKLFYGIFIAKDGCVYVKGVNSRGQLGLGHNDQVNDFTEIKELLGLNIVNIYEGNCCMFARVQNGPDQFSVYGWGGNKWGQLGIGKESDWNEYLKPTKIEFFETMTITDISCGDMHNMALTSSKKVFGWGENSSGQLGQSLPMSKFNSLSPIEINFVKSEEIVHIFCFSNSSFAIGREGAVYFWGENIELWSLPFSVRKVTSPSSIPNLKADKIICNERSVYFINERKFYQYNGHKYPANIVTDIEIDESNNIICLADNSVAVVKNEILSFSKFTNFTDYFIKTFLTTYKLIIENKPTSGSASPSSSQNYFKTLSCVDRVAKNPVMDQEPQMGEKGDASEYLMGSLGTSRGRVDKMKAVYDSYSKSESEKRARPLPTKEQSIIEELEELVDQAHLKSFEAIKSLKLASPGPLNELVQSVDKFKQFCSKDLKPNLKASPILFGSINFALQKLQTGDTTDSNQEIFKDLLAYFEFGLTYFKYHHFKNDLDFSEVDQVYEQFKSNGSFNPIMVNKMNKQYSLFEKMAKHNEIYLDKTDKQNLVNEDATQIVEELASESELKFDTKINGITQWFKNSVNELIDSRFQLFKESIISQTEYIKQANRVVQYGCQQKSQVPDTYIYKFNYNQDKKYNSHRRIVTIKKVDCSFVIINYLKTI